MYKNSHAALFEIVPKNEIIEIPHNIKRNIFYFIHAMDITKQ